MYCLNGTIFNLLLLQAKAIATSAALVTIFMNVLILFSGLLILAPTLETL